MTIARVEELLGQTLRYFEISEDKCEIYLETVGGEQYKFYHSYTCCENVYVEDVIGDLNDLIGEPILEAEESESETNPPGYIPNIYQDSFTWTFYKLGTRKGSVTIRWYGESNGYYSESVDFERIT